MLAEPPLSHPRTKCGRRREFLRLLMPHAVVYELSQVQRVGEIVEIRQLVRNMKFTRFPDIDPAVLPQHHLIHFTG